MNTISTIAIAGLLIAVIGVGHVGGDARPLAWGLAICIAVLVHGMRSLQGQIDELKFALDESKEAGEIGPANQPNKPLRQTDK